VNGHQVPQQGQWWVKVPAGQFGPLDLDTLRTWAQQHRITPHDFVYSPETKTWTPAASVPQLAGLFPSGPPQAPFPGAMPPQVEKKGVNVGCIIGAAVGVLFLLLLAGMLLPALARAREAAHRASCLSNMKQTGLAMHQYGAEHKGYYPWQLGRSDPDEAWRDVGMLYPNYLTGFGSFICPSSDDRDVTAPHQKNPADPFSAERRISYSYGYARPVSDPARPWREKDRRTVRILADKKAGVELTDESNHKRHGRNILYNDGHVAWKAGPDPVDPDPETDRIGESGASHYTDWWSDPPYSSEVAED
jgi:prepilin-type processing-associated H-X9-DG protein